MGAAADFASGTFSILSGLQQKEEMKAQAMAAEYNAGIERIRGLQGQAQVRQDLNETIAAINTLQAARGVDIDSASARMVRDRRREKSYENENNVVLGSKLSELDLNEQARGLRRGAPWAAAGGFIQGLSDFDKGAQRIAQFFANSGGGGGG